MPVSSIREQVVKELEDMLVPPENVRHKNDKILYTKLVLDTINSWSTKKRKDHFQHRVDHEINKAALTKLIATVLKTGIKGVAVVMTGKLFRLNASVRSPARTFDKDTLKVVLVKDYKISPENVDKIIEMCSEDKDPAKDFTVEDA